MNIYFFQEKQLLGNVVEEKEYYDLITVAMVCFDREAVADCEGLIKLLSLLSSLINKGRSEDVMLAVSDANARWRLYRAYGLSVKNISPSNKIFLCASRHNQPSNTAANHTA